MSIKTWKALSKCAKVVKYRINRKLGEKLQDIVDGLYEEVTT